MSRRPFISLGIVDLEKRFDQEHDDQDFLEALLIELSFRKTKRAKALQQKALTAKGNYQSQIKTTVRVMPNSMSSVVGEANTTRQTPEPEPLISAPLKRAVTDLNGITEPERTILSWTALEVLSPQSFRKAEDLVSGDKYRIAKLSPTTLPWDGKGERSRKDYRLYYQIILGTIDMGPAITDLLKVYSDARPERPQANGKSIIATVLVDKYGCPVEDDAYNISSFAWGLPVALEGDLKALGDWKTVEASLQNQLKSILYQLNDEGGVLPITQAKLAQAYEDLKTALSLPEKLCTPPSIAVKTYQYYRNDGPPETLLLNSFYLDDLAKCCDLFRTGKAPENLQRYLGKIKPSERYDLLNDETALAAALHPSKLPLGSWPGEGRYPLVTLQQTAVNLAASDLGQGGILAVNGPPGTGKTTLLRDVVADIVTKRASIMATYDNPEDAFTNSQERIRRGQAFLSMYKTDDALRGFEMVVASSNNKAVENVSAELPAREAVAKDAFAAGYFKPISDTLLGRDSWGLVAAVLGNGKNRAKFRRQFWWDKDTGLSTYLRHVTSSRPQITYEDENGKEQKRPPHIITQMQPPSDSSEALVRWKTARKKFQELEKQTNATLTQLSQIANIPNAIAKLEAETSGIRYNILDKREVLRGLENQLPPLQMLSDETYEKLTITSDLHSQLLSKKPNLFSRLFKRKKNAQWISNYTTASKNLKSIQADFKKVSTHTDSLQQQIQLTQLNIKTSQDNISAKETKIMSLKEKLKAYAAAHDGQFIDNNFFHLEYREKQMAAPWLGTLAARQREDLFEAAMELHRAFIDAAAKPLRHNIGLLVDNFGTQSFGTADRDALIPHLWSSLFLVVPVISTTFASVGRMFSRLEAESLGWLLIDEAGQALPQAAAGAIMRCKRAVVVGDPMQIEPVVILPDHLTDAICREFKIDETRYNAPAGSAQTLADSATSHYASFETEFGERSVGVPLLVHRRCEDPMFSTSNKVAYQDLMVQAKAKKGSPISDILGSSHWIDVQRHSTDKWCVREGEIVLDLLRKLKAANAMPNIYIVTPFVIVQNNLRQLIVRDGLLKGWVDNPHKWPYERIGTVHTVQGREAEAVIFVLGAPDVSQSGARNWAGGRPNLLNVAVSRAKEALYVVGNKSLWKKAGVFSALAKKL